MKDLLLRVVKKPLFWVVIGGFMMLSLVFFFYRVLFFGVRPEAVLEINSSPPRATVHVNARDVGRTPYIISSMETLTGEITISAPGYNKIELNLGQLGIKPGEHKRIRVDLELNTKLKIVSEPAGANLYIDGELWGSTPYTFEGLIPSGTHKIKAELLDQCYGEVEQDIVLESGMDKIVELKLPKLGEIWISTNPRGAKVTANEKDDWGTTNPTLHKCLEPGTYKVKIELEGYITEEKEIKIESSEDSITVNIRLYTPEGYVKRDAYYVESDQPDTEITAVAKRASDEIFGAMVPMGKIPASTNKDEIMKSAGIDSPPASFIIIAQKEGFSPGITELPDAKEVYFPMSILSTTARAIQKKYQTFTSHQGYQPLPSSSDGRYTVEANSQKATLKDTQSGMEWALYLEDEEEVSNNLFTFSPDSGKLWFFRKNNNVRELVERDITGEKEKVIDTIDAKSISWAKSLPLDMLFSPITHVYYDSFSSKLYYLVPASRNSMLSLASINPGGSGKTIIHQNLLPASPNADNYRLWVPQPGILKIFGIFPGSIPWEGFYHLPTKRPVKFSIRTDPDPNSRVGMLKQLESGLTMFSSCALLEVNKGMMVIGANIYDKIAILFLYNPNYGSRGDWEFVAIRLD